MNKETFTNQVLAAETTLYRVAKTILIQEADCEDAVQEAILKAYEKRNSLREEKFFKTWLIRILMNECYRIQKKKQFHVSYEDYISESEPEVEENNRDLQESILELPEKIRITVVLYYIEGYSIEEIKKILHIPSGTVKSRLAKGRKLLRNKLECMEVRYDAV